MQTTIYRDHRIVTKRAKSKIGVGVAVSINGHHVWTYTGDSIENAIARTKADVDASIERPHAYAWSRGY